jgi:uncharacterized protein with PQ loop repeat
MEQIGWLGSILLAFCGLPQAIESIKTKSSEGLTWGFILMWFIGEIMTFVYILPKMDLPLLFNYTANIIFLGIIIFYKLLPKYPRK